MTFGATLKKLLLKSIVDTFWENWPSVYSNIRSHCSYTLCHLRRIHFKSNIKANLVMDLGSVEWNWTCNELRHSANIEGDDKVANFEIEKNFKKLIL